MRATGDTTPAPSPGSGVRQCTTDRDFRHGHEEADDEAVEPRADPEVRGYVVGVECASEGHEAVVFEGEHGVGKGDGAPSLRPSLDQISSGD